MPEAQVVGVGVTGGGGRLPRGSTPPGQLCQPLLRDGRVTELPPGLRGFAGEDATTIDRRRWWLLETSWDGVEYAYLLPSSLPDALTGMLLGFVTKRRPAGNQRCGGSTRCCATGWPQQKSN
jgi:hypothetical protein